MRIEVKIVKLPHFEGLSIPSYATQGSAGLDLSAAIDRDITLSPNARQLIETGVAIQLPLGYEAQVRSRSGLAIKNGVSILNSPGTIDSDYRGELKVILINFGTEDFVIKRGDRIAQLVVSKVEQVDLIESNEIDDTSRGAGGFGSTGI